MRFKPTENMLDHLQDRLEQYHKIFAGDGCKGIPLEELIFTAIQSDYKDGQVNWMRTKHDAEKDIEICPNAGNPHLLQIKTGQVRGGYLVLSGYRLGRFKGNLQKITDFLNSTRSYIMSAAYERSEIKSQIKHTYQIRYITPQALHGITATNWTPSGKSLVQDNHRKVKFRLQKSMSWQVWWSLPIERFRPERTITI